VISVPLSYFGGIGSASTRGILIKGSNYLDALAGCDTIVFDKTGTLTEGVFEVTELRPADGVSDIELLSIAAAAEKYSAHPIALSVIRACEEKKCTAPAVTNVEEMAGMGIRAQVDGNVLLVGNAKMMRENKVSVTEVSENCHGTCLHVAFGGKYLGSLVISDRPRTEAKKAIEKLRQAGVKKTVMLTGDRESVAQSVADALGIDEFRAELLPQDKVFALESLLNKQSGKLAFVGDGINDAPVLARADIGIAMGALGSDAAIEAADIVLMNDDLQKIGEAILLSRRTRRIVIQNIVFALGIKIAVLILGALGIVGLNAAVFADVGVAVLAILNAMRNLKS
jgi:Cd2+/Zn2+-exporting ATPase